MSTTYDSYTLLNSLSDLEVRLFSAPVAQAANTVAFVEEATPRHGASAANERSLLPDPPKSQRPAGIIESVLLRAA